MSAPETSSTAWSRWKERSTGGQTLYPLVVLFGLNAVDELDRTAFGILLPEIGDHFGLNTQGLLALVALSSVAALLLAVPIGYYADRVPRVPLCILGAALWGTFSLFTGLAATVVMLGIARAGSGLGRAFNEPLHNSLIADYYDIPVRPRVYSIHRMANATGQFVGPFAGGVIAYFLGWRAPFLLFTIPTVIFLFLALRLHEPVRGKWERSAAGASAAVAETEDRPPSWAESWRAAWQVGSLRRIFGALPFLALAVVGFIALSSLFYDQVFGLNEVERGFVAAAAEPAAVVGLIVGIPIATRLIARGPRYVIRFAATAVGIVAVAFVFFSQAPNLPVAIAMNIVISGVAAMITPAVFAVLSIAVPPKIRAFGFSIALLWVLPGLAALPAIGALADRWGIRAALLLIVPILAAGALILLSIEQHVDGDVKRVWTTAAAQSEALFARRHGESKLLIVRNLEVAYDNVQVLFGVDLEVDEGEIVALLGTNGAGKSTLLKAISGIVEPSGGAIVFDGLDQSATPPNEVAGRGVAQVPGGQGVFPSLTVAEHFELAEWLRREDETARAEALELFPVLAERWDEPAGNLSGGQQQMLTLAMAFVERPRLLLIDELSLGLAPTVVEQLLEVVRVLRDRGTTILLVEQSVNLALAVAERAYFMEKGEIRFDGATADLLERPDVLRSVFLEGAAATSGIERDGAGTITVAAVRAQPTGDGAHPQLDRLVANGVTRRFGGIAALSDVSFGLRDQEILGFLGPNGAGKTTLFDVISGFLRADAGTVTLRVDGSHHDITRASPSARAAIGLGRSFQDGRLFPALTVEETIAVALERQVTVRDPVAAALHLPAVYGSERAVRARVDELVELLGLGAFRDKFVHELSTGSRRIVDLACTLGQQPSVLLLDEPSSGIAQREAEALAPLLLRIRRELDASILIVEHDIPLLMAVADRLVALDLGEVIAVGSPNDVIEDPSVVGSYLGTGAAVGRSGAQLDTRDLSVSSDPTSPGRH